MHLALFQGSRIARGSLCALVFLFGAVILSGQDAKVGTQTLTAAQSRAFQLFKAGDYAGAEAAFADLLERFGNEPEIQTESAQKLIIGIRAYLAFLLGDYEAAVERFREYLKRFPEVGPSHAFSQFTLAQSLELTEAYREAAAAYALFAETYPDRGEASLARLRQIDLLFKSGADAEAFDLSLRFASGTGPLSIRQQALLRALRERIDRGQMEEAFTMLSGTTWQIDTMPELAVLTFAALQIGDDRMAQRKFDQALTAYRYVPPSQILIDKQAEAIRRAEAQLELQKMRGGSGLESAWIQYYEGTVQRMRSQLDALERSEDYTPGYFLRFGTAFLSLERNYEAWIVFRNLSIDERAPLEVREEAHYRWILAAFQMSRWEEAVGIAREFQERFPESRLAPDALYLVARTYQEDKRYRSAIEVLDDLLVRFPDHRLAARWLYTRGYNRSMTEDYPGARKDFGAFVENYPDSPLVPQARLWSALTYDFEKAYPAALEALRDLQQDLPQQHPIEPEVAYRIASALYGATRYPEAREALDAYMGTYPGHQRIPEAQVLKGDILMGLGDLDAALEAFGKVTPEAAGLFPYAIFQRGKIYQALEDYDGMISHFSEYLEREDLPINARLSEALYWIGWAWGQKGESAKAVPAWQEALDRYGNDPAAREIGSILAALEQLKRQLDSAEASLGATDPFTVDLVVAPSFVDWLQGAGEQALKDGRLTWHSRVRLYEADIHERRKDLDRANTVLLEIDEVVDLADLDPEAAGRIGLIYLDFGYDRAQGYFEHVLDAHETHPARAWALRGMGELFLERGDAVEAERYLVRLNRELPGHPAALDGKLLLGQAYVELGLMEQAEAQFNAVLELKFARGEPHAEAMRGLARMNMAAGNPQRAIPYWQKIYNMYRAFPERMGEAYLESARLFETMGDVEAAYRSVVEMLGDERIAQMEIAAEAREMRDRLAPVVRELEAMQDAASPPIGTAGGGDLSVGAEADREAEAGMETILE